MQITKIYFWACDFSKNSGEGILANLFIKKYSENQKSISFLNINTNFKDKKKKFDTTYNKYIFPFLGVINLWIKFFQKKKICYINYLPLWNFLIFLLLPPGTILGPITGSINRKKIYSCLINFFERISLVIINFRYKKVIFSHNFHIVKYSLNKKKFYGTFILSDFIYKKKNLIKKFDFVIYYRNNSLFHKKYIFDIINELKFYNYSFAIIGDKINLKGNKNFGYVSRIKAQKIISQSKFAISNPENLYSFFVQDCLANHLTVFYNIYFKKFNSMKTKKLVPISFNSTKKDLNIILNKTKKIIN